MPRVAAISASDVISFMLFDNEGAGNVSDDELPDQIEINSDDDDEISNHENDLSIFTNLETVEPDFVNADCINDAILLENNLNLASNFLVSSMVIFFNYFLEFIIKKAFFS